MSAPRKTITEVKTFRRMPPMSVASSVRSISIQNRPAV